MARSEWSKTTELIDAALDILREQQPMTIRQLFYQMIGVGEIQNDQKSYKLISRIMTTARRDERCPYCWICDRTRPTYQPSVWSDPQQYAVTVKHGYRRDYWQDQPYHVEVWCEKDTVTGSIQELTDELGITVRVGRGFTSETRAWEIAQILAATGKRNVVLFLGDHDPSGHDIERDWRSRLLLHGSDGFKMRRIAINREDIAAYNLPPQRVKASDTRSPNFVTKYGAECVELDALPPSVLRDRIRSAVEGFQDKAAWDRAVAVEKVELACIVETVSKWGLHS